MPIPIRSSDRNISTACCLVRDILFTPRLWLFLLVSGDWLELYLVRGNTGPPLQLHGIHQPANLVTVHAVGLVVPLFEVHDPTRLTAPIAEALTLDVEIVPHVGMEDEGQRRETRAGDLVGIALQFHLVGPALIHGQKTRLGC